jgi:hypothetical protein
MKQYIRFKNIPTNEISNIYDGDLGIVGTELGTSCYEFVKDENYYKIILSSLEIGFLYDLIEFINDLLDNKIPVYLIEAEPVGLGTYGEPVVKNIKIIKKLDYIELAIPKPKYKMDKTNKQLTVTETIKNS